MLLNPEVLDTHIDDGYGVIYRYDFGNGRSYIGQSRNSLYIRHMGHVHGRQLVDVALRTQDYTLSIIEIVAVDDLPYRETFNILKFNTYIPMGYNLTLGGEITVMSEYTKQKISEDHIRTGLHVGRVHSDEVRKRESEAQKKRWRETSPERRREIASKVSAGLKGKKHTDEYKRDNSERLKRLWQTQEYGDRMRTALIERNIYRCPPVRRILPNGDVEEYRTARIAGREFGIDGRNIVRYCKGERCPDDGSVWEYIR